jgi:putative hydrolase
MSSSMIDWRFATSVGARIAGPGPEMSRAEADEVVGELREGAARSTPLVQEFTGLISAPNTAPVLVVDRANWVAANADSFAQVLAPIIDKMEARTGGASPLTQAIGSRVTGLEVGGMLGFLASKVLGQFDPFSGNGRLLLVAPNIV